MPRNNHREGEKGPKDRGGRRRKKTARMEKKPGSLNLEIFCVIGNNPRYGKASDGFSAPYVVLYGYSRTKEYHVGFPLYRLLFNELYRRGKLVLVANLAPKIVSPCMPCNCLITNKCVRYPAEFLFVLFDCVFWLFIPKSDGLFIFHRGERFAWSPKT